MYILGIESSCDETSAAVVEMDNGVRKILSNIVASQIDIHALYGGVVPEIASRAHIEAISSITYKALDEAGLEITDIDAIGVTNEPGLIGALLVGVNFAKSLAFSRKIPLVPVNHIKAHISAAYLEAPELENTYLAPPFTALVVSGGHTSIFDVTSYTDYVEIGTTRDDAAGEAFDKVGRVMGLPYPGGAAMDRLASEGNKNAYKFPLPVMPASSSGDSFDFSFSGLKTSVINLIHNSQQKGAAFAKGSEIIPADIAASFTESVVNGIVSKIRSAIKKTGSDKIVMAGGVAANSHLRSGISSLADELGIKLYLPSLKMCGDNAAMVAAQAYFEFISGNTADTSLNAYAN